MHHDSQQNLCIATKLSHDARIESKFVNSTAMAGHLLQLKLPGIRWSLGPGTPTRATTRSILTSNLRGVSRLRLETNLSRKQGLELGFSTRPAFVVAAVGNGEGERTSESDAVAPEPAIEENGSFPVESQDFKIHRRDPRNLFLYAAGEILLLEPLHQALAVALDLKLTTTKSFCIILVLCISQLWSLTTNFFMILAIRVLRDRVDARRIRIPGDQFRWSCIVNHGRHSGE